MFHGSSISEPVLDLGMFMHALCRRKYAAGHKQARRQLGGPGVGSGGGGSRGPM